MRVPLLQTAALWLFLQTCFAVFVDDAWEVDYHLALLGLPLQHTTFFHQPFSGSKASLIYTLSEKNVLGAVNPKDGNLVWRQKLGTGANSTTAHLRAGEAQDVVISAVDGQVSAWSASDGRLVWSLDLGQEQVKDLEVLALDEGKEDKIKDALVLYGETRAQLKRINAEDGQTKWTYIDESGDTPYQISASETEVFYISLHTTMLGGHKIKVTSLNAMTGQKTNEYSLSSETEVSATNDILSVGANTASPVIAWTDKAASVLKINVIGTNKVSSFSIDQVKGQGITKVILHAPYHTQARPHFLVHYQTADQHWADVYHVDLKTSSVSKAYSLPKLAGKGAFSTSSSDANVHFTRITDSEVSVVSSASHGILARWPIRSMGVVAENAVPVHAISEISVRGDSVSASRSAVLLSSGDWITIRDGIVSWQRPEILAHTNAAVWAFPSTDNQVAEDLEKEAHSNIAVAYVHRLRRHLGDLETLPAFLSGLPEKIRRSVGLESAPAEASSLSNNNFGYHKIVVCATDKGRLLGLDVGSKGNVVWNVEAAGLGHDRDYKSPLLFALPDGSVAYQSQPRTNDAIGGFEQRSAINGASVPHNFQVPKTDMQYHPSHLHPEKEIWGHITENGSPAWRFRTRDDEVILSLAVRPINEPVASIGKVLGDRSVLYKYLNPNLLMVAAGSKEKKTLSISILDSTSGATLYSVRHNNVDLSLPTAITVSENWFAYSLNVDTGASGSKGHQLVIAEMYESYIPNDRGPSRNASDGALDYQPYVALQTYIIPEPISLMTASQTGQGITSKDLLIVLPESNAILGVPRAFLDARRPVGRDPNKNEQFEGLMRYTPLLEFDPKWMLNHQREVVGIAKVTTSPALLESTSLVFAYGLDIFGTRISPSFSFDVLGKDFNKLQMMATVVALFIGTLIVAPIVARKQVDTRWQFTSGM